MTNKPFPGSKIIDGILDTAQPPVARFRLLSGGLALSHMLPVEQDIAGYEACLSCGNCVDVCPVIGGSPHEDLVAKTSMALEYVVGRQCRRCYKCVAVCPQVDRPMKDYVRSYRRIERIVHWMLMVSVVTLMLTGISVNHFKLEMPDLVYFLIGVVHRFAALSLLSSALLYFWADRHHMGRAFNKVGHWDEEDRAWFSDAWKWVVSRGREGQLMRGDFNAVQKLWYTYIICAVPLFALTGIVLWLGPNVLSEDVVASVRSVHVTLAWMNDILLLTHVCLKIVYPWTRDIYRGIRASVQTAGLRKARQQSAACPNGMNMASGLAGGRRLIK